MYDILTIGSATGDVLIKSKGIVVAKSDMFPTGIEQRMPLGSKVEIDQIAFSTGGGGANAAVTFARQGMKTAAIAVVGDDVQGRAVVDLLNREGVDTAHVQHHNDNITAYSVIVVADDGERTILSYKGEGHHFDVTKVPFDQLQAKWVYLDSLGGHYDLFEAAVNWAFANNVRVATNPGGKELAHGLEKLRPLFKKCAIVMMNQEEAAELTGIPYEKEDEIFQTMDEIVDGIFVLTKGPQGVAVSDGQHIYRAGVPGSPVVERTGAGDAFNSGFTTEYARSGDIMKAIQLGTANASSVVAQFGATAGILKQGDLGPWTPVEVSQQ